MRTWSKAFFPLTFFLLLVFWAAPLVAAGSPPAQPAAYWGSVQYNDGSPVQSGTVEAVIEGEVYASITIKDGFYGGPGGGDPKLIVQEKDQSLAGKSVSFRVSIDGTVATTGQSVSWVSGDVRQVDLALPVAAPGGSEQPPGGGQIPDRTPPRVVVVNPSNEAADIPVNSNIMATFSEDVQGVSESTFTLKKEAGAGSPVAAAVSYDSSTRTATLDPTDDLAPDTRYIATLTAEIKDPEGNPLSPAPYAWTFTTAGSGGTSSPGGGTQPGGGTPGGGLPGGSPAGGGGGPSNGGGGASPGTAMVTPSQENVLSSDDLKKAIGANPSVAIIIYPLALTEGRANVFIQTEAIGELRRSKKTLAVQTDVATVQFPAAAVSKEAVEKIAPGAADAGVRLSIAEGDKAAAGSFVVQGLSCAKVLDISLEVEAAGQVKGRVEKFDAPVTISIKLIPAELAGLNPELLGVYYLNPATGKAEYLGGRFDPASGVITFQTTHFSRFAVMEYKKVFADVPAGHWAYGDIQAMAARHVMGGVSETSFAPEANVTRAQFAAMLMRALGLSTIGARAEFKDVTPDKWYYRDVAAAFQNGLVSGYSQDSFGPEDPVTREQMAAMLVRALNRLGKAPALAAGEEDTILKGYLDKNEISPWAARSSAASVKAGLIKGRGTDTFAPQATATRAEGAALLRRFMIKAGLI